MTDILQTVRTLTDMGVARDAIADVQYSVDVLESAFFQIPCDFEECGKNSAWYIECPACLELDPICADHVTELLTNPADPNIDCHGCGQSTPIKSNRFIPLTPRSTP